MRICLFTPTFFPKVGGAEMCIDQLARQFARKGHHVVVAAPHVRGSDEFTPDGYQVARYQQPVSQRGFYLRVKRFLTDLQAEQNFDLFNAHLAYPSSYLGVWFARRFGVPFVVTPHGGGVFYRSRFRQRPVIWNRIQQGLTWADAVTTPSSYFEKLVGNIAPLQRNIIRITNGVDNQDFSTPVELNADLRNRCGDQFILALGRLVPRKGFDTAIAAFSKIQDRVGQYRLAIAGDGSQREELHQFVQKLNLADRVAFLGTVVGADKVALMQHCQFSIAPSVDEDNMPLVVTEALACGKPVLASRIGGIPDVIEPGVNGFLCEPGNADEFAAEMARMIETDAAQTMSDAARKTGQALDWKNIAGQYLEVFDSVLATGAAALKAA